jgi:DNA-binding IclR family transcriptional regulator
MPTRILGIDKMANVDPAMDASSAAQTSSHTRLIEVLDALVKRVGAEPWGVRELAAELNESRSTVNRILLALVERGLALETGAGKYRLGPRLSVLTHALSDPQVLLSASSEGLRHLAETSDATALISICCPATGGYFVAACEQAKSSLMFRPQLGVMYPLTFGDLGRQFMQALGAENCGLKRIAQNDLGLLSEAEFPQPLCATTRYLANGLLVAVSVHSVHGAETPASETLQAEVTRLGDQLAAHAQTHICSIDTRSLKIAIDDPKMTAARLERLLLLACACPEGIINTAGLHQQLLCNVATCKRLVESGLHTEIISSVGSVLFPGPKLFQWAAKIGRDDNIADLTRPTVQALVEETGETIAILSYDETLKRAQFLDVIQGWRPIQYQLAIHADVPLYAGAAGKAVLAFCDPQTLDSIELIKITEATITSRPELECELSAIQERGWATGNGERVPGAFGLAVPFFADGKIRGSISATIPQYRKDDRDLPRLTQLMLDASAKIERLLSLGIATH